MKGMAHRIYLVLGGKFKASVLPLASLAGVVGRGVGAGVVGGGVVGLRLLLLNRRGQQAPRYL